MNPKDLFQYISYLQYPLMLIALFYSIKPMVFGFETIWDDYNNLLMFMGLAISFSTLQDTTKTQNKISQRVWENPTYGKITIGVLLFTTFLLLAIGITGLYAAKDSVLKNLSMGVIVLGLGMIGMAKAMLEMFENHRLDKKEIPNQSYQ